MTGPRPRHRLPSVDEYPRFEERSAVQREDVVGRRLRPLRAAGARARPLDRPSRPRHPCRRRLIGARGGVFGSGHPRPAGAHPPPAGRPRRACNPLRDRHLRTSARAHGPRVRERVPAHATPPLPAAMPLFASAAAHAALDLAPGAPLLALRDVEKSHPLAGGTHHVLRRVALDVRAGEFVTIMGPSGAGKSTLLGILGLLDHDWRGEFQLAGQPVHAMAPKARTALGRRHVGFVFQQYHLLDDLTVAENLDVPLEYRGVRKSERQALVADALDRFGIVGKKDLFPRQLSGGQQQLVGVARAVVARPALLLADEPTGNLHTAQAREIMALFQALNAQGTTIVQVTHAEENARAGSRIVELRDGWVVDDRAA